LVKAEALSAPAKTGLAADEPAQQAMAQTYGTRVLFLPSPTAAARLAQKQDKLVFTLHVSGNFEDPQFT
jgi:hypothetical protein